MVKCPVESVSIWVLTKHHCTTSSLAVFFLTSLCGLFITIIVFSRLSFLPLPASLLQPQKKGNHLSCVSSPMFSLSLPLFPFSWSSSPHLLSKARRRAPSKPYFFMLKRRRLIFPVMRSIQRAIHLAFFFSQTIPLEETRDAETSSTLLRRDCIEGDDNNDDGKG